MITANFMEKKFDEICRIEVQFFVGEEWVGAASLVIDDCNSVGIWDVEIDKNLRGKGYGNQMMKEIVEYIFHNIMLTKKIYLYVRKDNTPAVKAYLYAGFEIISRDIHQYLTAHSYMMEYGSNLP